MADTRRIVAIDDALHDLEFIQDALGAHRPHVQVQVSRDGVGGLALIEQAVPDLVLLDLKLPKLSGLEVLARIRDRWPRALLPVVVFTSSGEPRDLLRAYEAGVSSYVVKPVAYEEFAECVMQVVDYWLDLSLRLPRNEVTARG